MNSSIDLSKYDSFIGHSWLTPLFSRYERDFKVARQAIAILIEDLENINKKYHDEHKRVIFTNAEGRVKPKDSFFKKLYKLCCEKSEKEGISPRNLEFFYAEIKDLAGVRFACPYYDEVEMAINNIIRPRLKALGYATNLEEFPDMKDKNMLDYGDELGYRSYHFFVKIPTIIDIFGGIEHFICEVQGRSELQHIWAVRSHDLLYKHGEGWNIPDEQAIEDMRQLSNTLRAADQFFVSIRDRIRRK